jgi:hypothetical protein
MCPLLEIGLESHPICSHLLHARKRPIENIPLMNACPMRMYHEAFIT